jgi:GNAT superfamily N-acetyltransferase
MPHYLLLPLLLYMDFGGNPAHNFATENCLLRKSSSSIIRFNRAYHTNDISDDEVEQIKSYFGTTPFSWFIESDDHKTADVLNRHGFIRYSETFYGMQANIENIADYGYGQHIAVQEINEQDDIETLVNIIFRNNPGYEESEWAKAIHELREKGAGFVKLYLGFYDDDPCATSIIIYHEDTVTLHLINTLSDYRGKGLGCAVTHKALFDAASHGKTQAVLTASLMGQSLYKKMGFEEYAQYYIYLHK